MKKIFKNMLTFIVISILIYLGIAGGLILSQPPTELPETATLVFPQSGDAAKDQAGIAREELTEYAARDGEKLTLRHYAAQKDDAPLVVIVHGSGWHGGGYTDLAQSLAQTGTFEVLLPDLRGHGPKTSTRGDVAYIGQLEDDLFDLIQAYRSNDQKVLMVGHSSGGGLVIRFAGGAHGAILDKAVLMAPYLKYDAPTMRENSGGWAHALTRRIIGLAMLNNVRINWFNGLTAVQFNFPKAVLNGPEGAAATKSYSYRLNTSYAPRLNYLEDIAVLPDFLLIVGEQDDAFKAQVFETTMKPATNRGTYEIVPGVDHLGLLADKTAANLIAEFLAE